MSQVLIDESWPAEPTAVPAARRTVLGHLRASLTPDPPLADIGLAVSEAVTNVVQHAYVNQSPGPVRVRVESGPVEIEVMVEDAGRGMAPRMDSPGLGLGLPVIATLAERFDVRKSRSGGTRLCMWFVRDPGAATLPA